MDVQHPAARQLAERLQEQQTVVAVCHPLLQLEVLAASKRLVSQLATEDLAQLYAGAFEAVTGVPQLHLIPAAQGVQDRRRELIELFQAVLERQLRALRVSRIRLTGRLLPEAGAEVITWGLSPHDAVVLTVAKRIAVSAGIAPHLATFDADFRRVDGLTIWGEV
jgi:predicted nucleic acid-binding protein